jgi:hypothetical protein
MDEHRTRRVGLFGLLLGCFMLALSAYGFIADVAPKIFQSPQFVWIPRVDDPLLYWFGNGLNLIVGLLVCAGSVAIMVRARTPNA